MFRKRKTEIGFEKASVYHAIGMLLEMIFDNSKEVVFESDLDFESHLYQINETSNEENEEEIDFEDQLMSVIALLCESFKGRPDLIEECKNYCLLKFNIIIEDITFDNEQKPYLTLVIDNKAD